MTATMQQARLSAPPTPTPELIGVSFGWTDPDRKKSTSRKCAEALDAYRAKHGRDPRRIMTSLVDAPADTEIDGIPVVGRGYIGAGNFYLLMSEELPHEPF